MADEGAAEEGAADCPKCEVCTPGLPGWMATFSDMVTLLLTFFVLLLSFCKSESAKYEAALGSIRNAFGGNVLKQGEVIQKGKSPDNSPEMLESQEPIKPFPIDFLTMEGILDKHEINRESDESLEDMKGDLKEFSLADAANIYEVPEGIKVRIKDKIYFKEGKIVPSKITVEVFDKLIKMMKSKKWLLFVEGHASRGEVYVDQHGIQHDAFSLSSLRAQAVSRSLTSRGVRPDRITTVFYGDNRPDKEMGRAKVDESLNRRVVFMLRKRDLTTPGHKVESR